MPEWRRLGAGPSTSAALAIDTPIPTPTGWTTMAEIQRGDQVLGVSGSPVTVTHATEIAYERPCYRVTMRDGATVVADADHVWAVLVHGRSRKLVTTEELRRRKAEGQKLLIRRPAPVELPEAALPMDPYVLGLWLGDGSVGQSYLNIRSEDAPFMVAECHTWGHPAAWLDTISNGSVQRLSLGRRPGDVRGMLRELGILHTKAIPRICLRGSVKQRLALVQGLMDTDGYVAANGYCTFVNTNNSIARGFHEVLRSLGCRASITPIQDKRGYKDSFKIHFRGDPEMPPCRLPRLVGRLRPPTYRHRSVQSVEPTASVPVRGIRSDAIDDLFLAGRGMLPTPHLPA